MNTSCKRDRCRYTNYRPWRRAPLERLLRLAVLGTISPCVRGTSIKLSQPGQWARRPGTLRLFLQCGQENRIMGQILTFLRDPLFGGSNRPGRYDESVMRAVATLGEYTRSFFRLQRLTRFGGKEPVAEMRACVRQASVLKQGIIY